MRCLVTAAIGNCDSGWAHYRVARQCLYHSTTLLTYSETAEWCTEQGSSFWSPSSLAAIDDIYTIYASEGLDQFQLGTTLNRGSSLAVDSDGSEQDCDFCDSLSWASMPVTSNTGCIIVSLSPPSSEVLVSLQTCAGNHTFFCVRDDSKLPPWVCCSTTLAIGTWNISNCGVSVAASLSANHPLTIYDISAAACTAFILLSFVITALSCKQKSKSAEETEADREKA